MHGYYKLQMSNNSVQEKLAKIFNESFQVKRLSKEINDLKELREKGLYDIRMSLLKNQCLVFRVDILKPSYKDTKLSKQLQLFQQIKIVVRDNYPANPPKAYFMGNNMAKIGAKPFRDYIPMMMADAPWSAKYTITQIIKSFPNFIQKLTKESTAPQVFPTFQEYFELDCLLSWNFVQVHPIRLIKKSGAKQGFMVINVPLSQIILLDEAGLQSSYKTCDYLKGNQIISLRKKKNTTNRLLLEVKLSYPRMKGKYGIQFYSQDYDGLMIGIMDCSKMGNVDDPQVSEKQKKKQNIDSDQSSDSDDDQEQNERQNLADEGPINITEIEESIIVYESLVDNSMTSENINQLVQLLKKAIEHYSASGDERFRVYLDKLQNILSNEMAQVLLESANEDGKKDGDKKKKQNYKKQQFTSVVDLL